MHQHHEHGKTTEERHEKAIEATLGIEGDILTAYDGCHVSEGSTVEHTYNTYNTSQKAVLANDPAPLTEQDMQSNQGEVRGKEDRRSSESC